MHELTRILVHIVVVKTIAFEADVIVHDKKETADTFTISGGTGRTTKFKLPPAFHKSPCRKAGPTVATTVLDVMLICG